MIRKKISIAVICFCIFSSLSSQAVFAQDFSSIDNDLQTLESLINDTLTNTQEQQKLLENLKKNLDESGILIASYENTIQEQEKLLVGQIEHPQGVDE